MRYSTVSYPSAPTDGIAVENAPGGGGRFNGNPNQTMTFTHDGGTSPPTLDINTTYYYTIFAYDKCGNVSTAQATAQTAAAQCGDEDSGPSSGAPPQPTLPNPTLTNTCTTGQATLNWNLINDQFPGGINTLTNDDTYRSRASASYITGSHNAKIGYEGAYFSEKIRNEVNDFRLTYHYATPSTTCLSDVSSGVNPYACGNMNLYYANTDPQNVLFMRPRPSVRESVRRGKCTLLPTPRGPAYFVRL